MNCPICNVTLQITDRSGIEIDYCPKCRGVWLDRGELDKLIDRASRVDPWEGSSGRGNDREVPYRRDEEVKRQGHKKKSFWGEIFDFD